MPIKMRLAARALVDLVRDPMDFRGAMLISDALVASRTMHGFYARMLRGLTQAEIDHLRELTHRPVDRPALSKLPVGSFGRGLADFFDRHGLTSDAQIEAHPGMAKVFQEDWLLLRFVRTHDMHHVLAGFRPDVPGEMGLQAFNLVNFGEPYALLAMLAVPRVIAVHGNARETLHQVVRGISLARAAPNLFAAPLEDWYERDLGELRRELGLFQSPHD